MEIVKATGPKASIERFNKIRLAGSIKFVYTLQG